MVKPQKVINSDISFITGSLLLPSSLEWTRLLNLRVACKGRHSLAGDSWDHCPESRELGIQSMRYSPTRSTHSISPAQSPLIIRWINRKIPGIISPRLEISGRRPLRIMLTGQPPAGRIRSGTWNYSDLPVTSRPPEFPASQLHILHVISWTPTACRSAFFRWSFC